MRGSTRARAGGMDASRARRSGHRTARGRGDRRRHPHVLPGALRERGVPAHRGVARERGRAGAAHGLPAGSGHRRARDARLRGARARAGRHPRGLSGQDRAGGPADAGRLPDRAELMAWPHLGRFNLYRPRTYGGAIAARRDDIELASSTAPATRSASQPSSSRRATGCCCVPSENLLGTIAAARPQRTQQAPRRSTSWTRSSACSVA